MNKKDLISIIIVNYNGKKWLKKSLNSLCLQTYKNFEIIFVDNASTDGSIEFIKNNYPKVKIVQNKKNFGFAGGNNIGLKKAKREYIFLLNNDTVVDKYCIENLLKAFKKIPNLASVQPKILLMDDNDKIDECGAYWTDSTTLYHYGYHKNASFNQYNKPMPFFSNMGAAMLIKKDLIDKIGLFDDDFWCYYEETDFCHRVWLVGYECWYYPKAVVYHAKGGTSTKFDNSVIQFHNFKNKLLSFIKNFESFSLIKIISTYLILNTGLNFYFLFKGKFRNFLAFYKSLWWNIKNIKSTLKKRRKIQNLRVKSDNEIFKKIKKNPRLSYYWYLFKGLEKYKD